MKMEIENCPLVSIGLPVFNGQKGLARALDSLLEQDYPNLEINISDNASTDTTPEICGRYILKDARVKYSRLDENLGAIENFNQVFKLSSGKYFMWAADDDHREPSFIRACVEKMEKCPDAVLCQTHTVSFIEGRRDRLCVVNMNGFEGVTKLVDRYRETLKNWPATGIYGLYRSSAVRKTGMFQKVLGSDISFILELSIHGNFVQVPKLLFSYYGRKKWNTVHQDYKVHFGKDRKPWWYLPFITLFCNHWTRVARTALPSGLKLRLWWILIEHAAGQVALKILIKVCRRVCPAVWKETLACAIYGRWMRGPNLQIGCEDLFLERVIKPKLGWWS